MKFCIYLKKKKKKKEILKGTEEGRGLLHLFIYLLIAVLRIKPRAFHILGSALPLSCPHPQPLDVRQGLPM
jgi:hypothetical protein